MKINPIVNQHWKNFSLQILVSVFCILCYLYFDNKAWKALIFSAGIGITYSTILFIGIYYSNILSINDPRIGMAVLVFSAVVRFVCVGILIIIGFKTWSNFPLAVILPFFVMLISPIALLPFKKRLTD